MDIESTGNVDIDKDDLADAWCIFFIHKMMETGGEFSVTGPGRLSRSLLVNLDRYAEAWNRWMPNVFHRVTIHAAERDDSAVPQRDEAISCFPAVWTPASPPTATGKAWQAPRPLI